MLKSPNTSNFATVILPEKSKALSRFVFGYKTFDELLANERSERIVPGMAKDDLLALLREIYPPAKESLGVVVLEVAPKRTVRLPV